MLSMFDYCPYCKKRFREGDPVSVIRVTKTSFSIFHRKCLPYSEDRKEKTKVLNSGISLSDNVNLWRYMDLYKFISMLKNSSLYFSSPKYFKDTFEGANGELENRANWDAYYSNFMRTSIITGPDNCWHQKDEEEVETIVKQLLSQIENNPRKIPIYINCWHQNDFESEAMWKLYSSSVENAVAIKTTYNDLKDSLSDEVKILPVRYIDYSKSYASIDELYLYKRKSFEYEKEVRVFFCDYRKKNKRGLERKVDLKRLIKAVYVSPYSPDWYRDVVEDLVFRYGYDFEVCKSSMTRKPF